VCNVCIVDSQNYIHVHSNIFCVLEQVPFSLYKKLKPCQSKCTRLTIRLFICGNKRGLYECTSCWCAWISKIAKLYLVLKYLTAWSDMVVGHSMFRLWVHAFKRRLASDALSSRWSESLTVEDRIKSVCFSACDNHACTRMRKSFVKHFILWLNLYLMWTITLFIWPTVQPS